MLLGHWRRVCMGATRRSVARLHAPAGCAAQRRELPRMPVYVYNTTAVLELLQDAGVRRVHMEYTCHAGVKGVILFFQRSPDGRYLT